MHRKIRILYLFLNCRNSLLLPATAGWTVWLWWTASRELLIHVLIYSTRCFNLLYSEICLSDVRAVCCYWQLHTSHMTRVFCKVQQCDLILCGVSVLTQRETPLQMQYFPTEGKLDKSYFPYYGKTLHVSTIKQKLLIVWMHNILVNIVKIM